MTVCRQRGLRVAGGVGLSLSPNLSPVLGLDLGLNVGQNKGANPRLHGNPDRPRTRRVAHAPGDLSLAPPLTAA